MNVRNFFKGNSFLVTTLQQGVGWAASRQTIRLARAAQYETILLESTFSTALHSVLPRCFVAPHQWSHVQDRRASRWLRVLGHHRYFRDRTQGCHIFLAVSMIRLEMP